MYGSFVVPDPTLTAFQRFLNVTVEIQFGSHNDESLGEANAEFKHLQKILLQVQFSWEMSDLGIKLKFYRHI